MFKHVGACVSGDSLDHHITALNIKLNWHLKKYTNNCSHCTCIQRFHACHAILMTCECFLTNKFVVNHYCRRADVTRQSYLVIIVKSEPSWRAESIKRICKNLCRLISERYGSMIIWSYSARVAYTAWCAGGDFIVTSASLFCMHSIDSIYNSYRFLRL